MQRADCLLQTQITSKFSARTDITFWRRRFPRWEAEIKRGDDEVNGLRLSSCFEWLRDLRSALMRRAANLRVKVRFYRGPLNGDSAMRL